MSGLGPAPPPPPSATAADSASQRGDNAVHGSALQAGARGHRAPPGDAAQSRWLRAAREAAQREKPRDGVSSDGRGSPEQDPVAPAPPPAGGSVGRSADRPTPPRPRPKALKLRAGDVRAARRRRGSDPRLPSSTCYHDTNLTSLGRRPHQYVLEPHQGRKRQAGVMDRPANTHVQQRSNYRSQTFHFLNAILILSLCFQREKE
ncbi:atherin-like [Erinaceus europaeus]|uniref:Atherin-like n=1 Tax=Erinaceus europaeus TaxID=9365 RepID=A0ABM3WBX3_ERIEU|nr:atherin-like [Erinaceus europaeus]